MNQVYLQRDQGPVVRVGENTTGCVLITKDKTGTVSVATDGLSVIEEINALERALEFAKSKRSWKQVRKETTCDPARPNIKNERWIFDNAAQGQHFAFQAALAGLPMQSKKVQS